MITLLAAAAIALPSPAPASADVGMFGVAPVADPVLTEARGTALPEPVLTRGILRSTADEQARDGFRFGGIVAATQIDVWWGTIGSTLIASNVRGQ